MAWRIFKGLCFAVGFFIIAALCIIFLPFEVAGFICVVGGIVFVLAILLISDWTIALLPFIALLGIILWLLLL